MKKFKTAFFMSLTKLILTNAYGNAYENAYGLKPFSKPKIYD
ncbi:hypothetical protein FLAVO9AF_90028 [Flavobacterium sp. 9AF]|nr:hypothetical protein FLAVO9AF_90028 [Flavobacterium sp. 9AF]